MNSEIVESFSAMAREKRLDKDVLIGIIEDVFSMMVRKKYGMEARFEVVVNMDKGDIEIYLEKQIVETVTDPGSQIDLASVRRKTEEPLEIGDDYVEVVDLQTFGRRLVVSAKQNLNQRIKEVEKEVIFNEYSKSVDEIIVGEIYQIRKNEILVNHNRNELLLPKSEQIARERYRKGETVRAIVKEVRQGASNPLVIISRADPRFLTKLFEIEIPEIYDGIIEIKGVAREAGERSKVAVVSHDDRIDAVGACVGMKGVRIHAIVRELNNENIDVVNYSDDPLIFLQRSLAPAKLKSVELDVENKKATVIVDKDQVSLVIGRNGLNIRLASKLTGYQIELIKEGAEEEYDMDIAEFREELGEPLLERLIEEGYTTARNVLEAETADLLEIEGLTEEKVAGIKQMMEKELAEADVEDDEFGAESYTVKPEDGAPLEKEKAKEKEKEKAGPLLEKETEKENAGEPSSGAAADSGDEPAPPGTGTGNGAEPGDASRNA